MADRISKEARSYLMSQIRATNTGPERSLGEVIAAVFPECEVQAHSKELPGKPDYYLPTLGLVVFCDGCFFHGCRNHSRIPLSNREYWEPKIRRNQLRDRRITREIRKMGLRPLRFWEHDVIGNTAYVRRRLRRAVASQAS